MLKKIKKHKYLITFILVIVLICLVIVRKNNLKENNKEYTKVSSSDILVKSSASLEKEPKEEKEEKECIVENKIIVDIKGQVVNPGVYELSENARVMDVINMAGGLTDIANTSLINLSKKLEDQMVIIIYSNEEVLNSNIKEVETVFKVIEKECVCPNIKNDSCINTELDNNSNDENSSNKDNNTLNKENSDKEENKLVNINTASLDELMTISGIGESKAKSIIEYRTGNKFSTIEDIKNVSGIGDSLFEKIKAFITV